jgi:PAS domain S-box-containing protein
MESGWKWDSLDPFERQVAELLLEGKSNAAICEEVFRSRARVQDCIKRIVIKTETDSTRSAIVLLAEERETSSLLHILDQASDGVVIVQDSLLKFVNSAMAKLLGYAAQDMTDVPFAEFLVPESRDAQSKEYAQRLAGDQFPGRYTTRALCKTGEVKKLAVTSGGMVRFKGRPALMGIAVESR